MNSVRTGAGAAVVAVPVTNVWSTPDAPREIDRLMTAPSPDPVAWVAAMGQEELLGLHGRLETQALMGEPVVVVSERAGWAEVQLPAQPSRKDRHGYPGWARCEHLLPATPVGGALATVSSVLATCRNETGEPIVLSFATSLPAEEPLAAGMRALLRAPDGSLIEAPADALFPVPASSGPRTGERSPAGVLRMALGFVGVPYVWGGCSGFGVDCSGLVHLAHRAAGLVVPRDAHDQASAGDPVPASEAEPGDLLFFAKARAEPHHVAFSCVGGRMLHSPGSGRAVEEAVLAGSPYLADLTTVARRYAITS